MIKQEHLLKLNMLQEQLKQLEQQINAINQQIMEMHSLQLNLDDIEAAKKDKEMLAGLGKGIFVKTKLAGKKLFVNIGSNKVIEKDIPETKELIEKQISQLNDMKMQFAHEMEKTKSQAAELIGEIEGVEEK